MLCYYQSVYNYYFCIKFQIVEKEKIQSIILETIKEFSDNNGIEIEGEVSPAQRLIGKSGLFDSMDLVNFLVDLEEVLEDKFNKSFTLSDERAMSRSHSPFMNAEELTKFIIELDAEG